MSGFAASLPRVRRKRRRRRRPTPWECLKVTIGLALAYSLLSAVIASASDDGLARGADLLVAVLDCWMLRWRPGGVAPSYIDDMRRFWRECVRGTDEPD